MKIVNHWVEPFVGIPEITHSRSPNARDPIDPDFLVVHYTAGDTATSAINWFMNTNNNPDKIAAHIVIDQKGVITQLIPFTTRANHAGTSTWNGVDSFNYHAIGIELVNPGYVEKLSNGGFRREVDKDKWVTYPAGKAGEIIKAQHKHNGWTGTQHKYWFKFPKAQLESLYALASLLVQQYKLVTAVGHDDISPFRKPDPGPAFPWPEFKNRVFNRQDKTGMIFLTVKDNTGFFNGASTNAAQIRKLKKNYEVGLIETQGSWCKVYLVNSKSDVLTDNNKRSIKTIGWIHESELVKKPA